MATIYMSENFTIVKWENAIITMHYCWYIAILNSFYSG